MNNMKFLPQAITDLTGLHTTDHLTYCWNRFSSEQKVKLLEMLYVYGYRF